MLEAKTILFAWACALSAAMQACKDPVADEETQPPQQVVYVPVYTASPAVGGQASPVQTSKPGEPQTLGSSTPGSGQAPSPLTSGGSSGGSVTTPQATQLVMIQAQCNRSGSFMLQILGPYNNSSSSTTAFPGCDRLAAALNGKSFPQGNSTPVTTGGNIVSARCDGTNLSFSIRYAGNNSNQSQSIDSPEACQEIRDAINRERI